MSWGCGCLNQKACELVIVCLVGKVIQSVAKLYSWWFIISDLQCQVWQHSRHCTQMPSCRVLSRAPVVLDRRNRYKRALFSVVILARELPLSSCALLFFFFVHSGCVLILHCPCKEFQFVKRQWSEQIQHLPCLCLVLLGTVSSVITHF